MSLSKIDRHLYRSLLRVSRSVKLSNRDLYLQHQLQPSSEFSRFLYFDTTTNNEAIFTNFIHWPSQQLSNLLKPQLMDNKSSRWLSHSTIKQLIQMAFRRITPKCKEESDKYTDFGFEMLRELQSLKKLTDQTTLSSRNQVDVTITSLYSPENDFNTITDKKQKHTFFYRITIENNGDKVMQLLSRSFVFKAKDGSPPIIVPKWSPGVIGEKPILSKGEGFSYMSCCSLDSDEGIMQGAFQFTDIEGNLFEFDLGETPLTNIRYR